MDLNREFVDYFLFLAVILLLELIVQFLFLVVLDFFGVFFDREEVGEGDETGLGHHGHVEVLGVLVVALQLHELFLLLLFVLRCLPLLALVLNQPLFLLISLLIEVSRLSFLAQVQHMQSVA